MTRPDTPGAETPMFPERILANLRTPEGGLVRLEDSALVDAAGARHPLINGTPSLFFSETGGRADVTAKVKSFYEENPFPSYEGVEAFGDLVAKGSGNPFSKQLLDAVGRNKTVLECGCGTGQLSHFLQLNNNSVLGVDMSLASLGLAMEHKLRNGLARSAFCQMNIFNMAVADSSFDVVISHGVLHHTFDAKRAFGEIVRKAKPGGIVMAGLYNSYARIPTWLRSKVIGLLGPDIDYVVRNRIKDARKADIWIKDQYYNPHETWHSIDEVLGWFDEFGVEYLNCSPPVLDSGAEDTAGDTEGLFAKTSPGTRYQRIVTQLGWLGTIAREGALFDMIGRKK